MAYKYDLEFMGYYKGEIEITGVKIKGKGLVDNRLKAKPALARVMFYLCKDQKQDFGLNILHLENLYRIVKKKKEFKRGRSLNWLRGIHLDINQLQFQSYCNICKKKKGDVYSCRANKRNDCIVSNYYRQDRKEKSKIINVVLGEILKEESFRKSSANIFNLVEIENDSFKIKNVRSFTIPPEPEYTGEESVVIHQTGKIDLKGKIKKIVNELIKGKNLQDVWLLVLNMEHIINEEEIDYASVIPLMKIVNIFKIAMECKLIGRGEFGKRYNGIFTISGKDCDTIKREMLNHARLFLK